MRADRAAPGEDYLDIARLVGTRRPLPILYRGVRDILARRMAAENMYVALLEGPDGLRFPYYEDQIEPEDEFKIYAREGLTAHVIDSGLPTWTGRDPGLLDRVAFIGPRPADWMGVPLKDRSGAAFGLLAVQTYDRGQAYCEADLALVEFAATQVSFAIQLQRLDREIAIARIASLVDDTTDLDELYPRLHAVVAGLIPAAERSFVIARIDEEAGLFRPAYWRDERDDWDSVEWPLDRGMSGYICQVTGASFIYDEAKTPLPPEIKPIGHPPRYWLGAPLYSGRRIIGVVFTQTYDEGKPLSRDDEATLVSICPHIAQVIGRTEFFELNYRAPRNAGRA